MNFEQPLAGSESQDDSTREEASPELEVKAREFNAKAEEVGRQLATIDPRQLGSADLSRLWHSLEAVNGLLVVLAGATAVYLFSNSTEPVEMAGGTAIGATLAGAGLHMFADGYRKFSGIFSTDEIKAMRAEDSG